MIEDRLTRLRTKLEDQGLDTLLVLQEENRRYLSGFTGEDGQCDESAGALFITLDRQWLATDSRYETQAALEAPEFEIYCYANGLSQALPEIGKALHAERVGFESVKLSYLQFQEFGRELKKQASPVSLVPTKDLVEELRITKDAKELAAIRQSLALSESAFELILEALRPGLTEKDLAWSLEKALREKGAESLAFPPIVAAGPNAALPHAIPADRPVRQNEPILFDWGSRLNGYCSDISRTTVLGEPDDTFKTVYQVVRDAQAMATEAIRPGVSTQTIDQIAREHIEAKGFGQYFGHGLGHGVGLAVHEKPRLSPTGSTCLEVGMVTTVEPGIYIPHWGGVRLENMVAVQEHGAEVLNRKPFIAMMDL
jgi:Xaa-Pro aminopeptidase